MQIQDGTGTGKRLKIDSNNRAQVRAQSELVIAVKSLDDGDAYQMYCPSLTLGGVAEHNAFYFKNTSETRSFVINKYFLSWNGGDTNHNRIAFVKQYINAGAPTANSTQFGAGNLNTGSGNVASMTVYYWDGVGTTGMTQTAGTQAGELQISQGVKVVDIQGSTVIAPQDSITISFTGEEVGKIGVTIEGYFD